MDLPQINTDAATEQENNNGNGATNLPAINTDLPRLSDAFTTPSITVPQNKDNPYVIRTSNVNGTVFIAVGVIVVVILAGFILYHFIVSITSSRLAKRSIQSDHKAFEKYTNLSSDDLSVYDTTSKHDLTRMFISPTAEVMQHKRIRSGVSNPFGNQSTLTLPKSQIHNLYVDSDAGSARTPRTGSDRGTPRDTPRKTIPSMYLEDLVLNR